MIKRYILEINEEKESIHLQRIFPTEGPEKLIYSNEGYHPHTFGLVQRYEMEVFMENKPPALPFLSKQWRNRKNPE